MAYKQFLVPKNKNLSFMTRFSVLGVAIGVFALVLVLSVMGGFEQGLRKKMFTGVSHLEILSSENALAGFSLKNDFNVKSLQNLKYVTHWTPFVRSDAVFIKKGKQLSQVTLLGVDSKQGGDVWSLTESLIESDSSVFDSVVAMRPKDNQKLPGLIISEGLAFDLNLQIGEVVNLLNSRMSSDQALGGTKASFLFRVSAIFRKSSAKMNKNFVITSLEASRKFLPDYDAYLDDEKFVTGVALQLIKPDLVDEVKTDLAKLTNLKIETWKEVEKSLLFALKLEKYTMGAILLLIILVAAFSISGTLMMSVYHKRNQMAVLRALGFSRKSILQLHLLHGTVIGFIGTVLGLVLGLGTCLLIKTGAFDSLFISWRIFNLPVKFLYLDYFIISLCAIFLSLLAAAYPAIVAANRYPSRDLRSL